MGSIKKTLPIARSTEYPAVRRSGHEEANYPIRQPPYTDSQFSSLWILISMPGLFRPAIDSPFLRFHSHGIGERYIIPATSHNWKESSLSDVWL